jgi:hypothetical protein
MDNIPMIAEARFYRVMSASAEHFMGELTAYRRVSYRHQLERHLARLKVLDRWTRLGAKEVRTAHIEATSCDQHERMPLVRLWLPKMEWVGADLYVDRIHGHIHMSGQGPYRLARRRILQQMLDAILVSPDLAIRVDDLFEQVWGGRYDPLAHEGRIHVNVHRLRRWFEDCRPGGGELVQVRDGVVQLSPEVVVYTLDLPGGEEPGIESTTVSERVEQCLSPARTRSPGQIQKLLGVSRSQINRTLRVLRAEGRIERTGAGRSTRYRLVGGLDE